MITSTSLKQAVFLVRIKVAIQKAIRKAHKSAVAIGTAIVRNRNGRSTCLVVWRAGISQLQIIDTANRDITPDVLAALRVFHMGQKVTV